MKRNRLLLILLVCLLPMLAGCYGVALKALPVDLTESVKEKLDELDHADEAEIKNEIRLLQDQISRLKGDKNKKSEFSYKALLLGYCWERLGDFGKVSDVSSRGGLRLDSAKACYYIAAKSEYASVAQMRIAQVAGYQTKESLRESTDPDVPLDRRQAAAALAAQYRKQTIRALENCSRMQAGALGLLRKPEVASIPVPPGASAWITTEIRLEAYKRLDPYYRDTLSYRVFDTLVRLCGGKGKSLSYALALVLLAVLAKLITTPLSLAQFKSLRAMQAIQPELKKIQVKYKDDKAQLAKAQMELFKEHGVNPASSCLPMLIQMPILLWVYWGIRHYTYQFMGAPFLYLPSLGDPDVIRIGEILWPGPMLVLYGLSMYFSQKLMATPAATPEQQQQQKMMAYMMPVLFILIMKALPAAFIFYWLTMNILMTGHQYLILRPQREAAGSDTGARS